MLPDQAKTRRESMRWYLLVALDKGRPIGVYEEVLLITMQGIWGDATQLEIRKELDYLESRKLLEVDRKPEGRWLADINHYGVDIVEYAIDCLPGIARPPKV